MTAGGPEATRDASVHQDETVLGATSRFVRLPPGRRYVWVPMDNRRSVRSGLSLYAATRRRGQVGSLLTSLSVRLAGPRVVPLPRESWSPPVGAETWHGLTQQWRALPAHDGLAVHERPQISRTGFGALLLLRGAPVAFLKVRQRAGSLDGEQSVLEALRRHPVKDVRTPVVMASGRHDDWSWLAVSPLPASRRIRRSLHDVPEVIDALRVGLRAAVGPRDAAPAHWLPMHGDLAAWNTRVDRRGELWIFDWEDAGWGPPDADDVYHRATSAVMSRRPAGRGSAESVSWWLEQVRARSVGDDDAAFNRRLVGVLEGMADV